MIFNSIDFAFFLPIVFILYWLVSDQNLRLQNFLIVAASYIFYGWWDWRFLALILISSLVDYFVGLGLLKQENLNKRKILLSISIFVNLGFLGIFKYYNFFLDNFTTVFSFLGSEIKATSLHIIIPVGISFYTFQTMSYSIDIYKRKLAPTKDFIAFSAFVSFFPQLVAGPIERATHLLPQFLTKRTFDYSKAIDGMRQILWGLFKKIVIADNCAEYANLIFNNSLDYSGCTLLLGAVFFTFQIYCDFSGYSDIAIGTSRLFGFDLKRNFNFPYFSRNIAEFWRCWHISLSSWFRDYLYIPLGGSRGSTLMKIRNIFIIFIVSGFWHGANWTFIAWGFLNALYIMPSIIFKTNRNNFSIVAQGKFFPTPKEFISMCVTFGLTIFAWIFFRAKDIHHAFNYIYDMFTGLVSKSSYVQAFNLINTKIGYVIPMLLICFLLIEWIGREQEHALANLGLKWKRSLRHSMYYGIIATILLLEGEEQQFIYFQF